MNALLEIHPSSNYAGLRYLLQHGLFSITVT